jgi:hypothetical protein
LERLRDIDNVRIKSLVGQASYRQEFLADDVELRFDLEDRQRLVLRFRSLDGPLARHVFLVYRLQQVPDAVCAVDVGDMEAELVLHLFQDFPKYLGLGDEGDALPSGGDGCIRGNSGLAGADVVSENHPALERCQPRMEQLHLRELGSHLAEHGDALLQLLRIGF